MNGQEPLNEVHGPSVGEKLAEDLRTLETQISPLLDRAHRMMKALKSCRVFVGDQQ
jgi:hypothetical protein